MKVYYLGGAVLALALAGCGGNPAPAAANNTAAAAPAPAASNAADTAGDTEAAPTAETSGGAAQNFQILNKTGHTVVSFNVSPVDEDQWGPDILGQDVLNDGESAKITFPREADQCYWDLRATYDDNDTTEVKKVDLCKIATVTLNP